MDNEDEAYATINCLNLLSQMTFIPLEKSSLTWHWLVLEEGDSSGADGNFVLHFSIPFQIRPFWVIDVERERKLGQAEA